MSDLGYLSSKKIAKLNGEEVLGFFVSRILHREYLRENSNELPKELNKEIINLGEFIKRKIDNK